MISARDKNRKPLRKTLLAEISAAVNPTHRKVRPALLRQLNERAVFEIVRDHGPISRAQLTRQSGITAPTASKVVSKLLQAGFLEEVDGNGASTAVAADSATKAGRPSKVYRL